jgi:hypothetical protein
MYAASPHGAARLPLMNTFARPADIGLKIKSQSRSQIKRSQRAAAPTWGLGAFSKKLVGCQAAIAGKPAPTKIKSQPRASYHSTENER